MATRRDVRASHFLKNTAFFLGAILSLVISVKPSRADLDLLPHRPWIAGFGSLCDAGPLVCTRIDEIGFNARIDAILLTSTNRRGIGLVAPYGFSFGILEHIEGGIYTQSAVWGQPEGTETKTRFQQGPMRFALKGLLWPWRSNPHQHFSLLLDFEYEARLPRFDGQNQLGLLTDLGALRAVANVPLGGVELGLSAGALFDWRGRYGTPELGARISWHLPFISDVKIFAEGSARGFLTRVNSKEDDAPIPGALDPVMPVVPAGVLGIGIASRQLRAVDFAMVVHVGFGDTAPFFLTLRFADIAWGKGYPRPQSMVVDAVRELAVWVREQIASIDPMFNEHCDMIDDPPPHGTGKSMSLIGYQTPDAGHCLWNGLWLKKFDEHGERIKYWKNKSGTLLCHDKARNHCFAQRGSRQEAWEPIENPAHRAVLRGDCIFEDAETKQRLTHFGTLTPDRRSCTDGKDTVPVGQYVGYNPALHQIDLGQQGPRRRGLMRDYKEPTTTERLSTALGRGIERGQQTNKEKEAQDKTAAADADAKIASTLKAAEEMTPASLMNGIEEAAGEAADALKHAAADPKGTFKQALDRIKKGIENTTEDLKEGLDDTKQAVSQGVDDAIDWSKKDRIDQAEDLLKFGGEKGATAHRDVTTGVATTMVGGGATRLVGGALDGVRDAKKTKQLLNAVKKEESKRHHPELPPNRGNGGRGGGPDHARVQERLRQELKGDTEVAIDLPNGKQRIVDVRGEDGSLNQVGDMRSRGGTLRPSARERGAIEDLRKAEPDATIRFIDKHDQHPPLLNPDQQPSWPKAPSKHRKVPD